jgi:hypothetical protein
MPYATPWRHHPFVERLARQRMGKAHPRAGKLRFEQVRVDGPLDDGQQFLFAQPGNLRPEVERHLLANHRRYGQRSAHFLAQARHAAVDHLAKVGRHDDAIDRFQLPTASNLMQEILFFQGSQQLFGIEGIPLGTAVEVGGEPRFIGVGQLPTAVHQRPQVANVQAAQVETEPFSIPDQRW